MIRNNPLACQLSFVGGAGQWVKLLKFFNGFVQHFKFGCPFCFQVDQRYTLDNIFVVGVFSVVQLFE